MLSLEILACDFSEQNITKHSGQFVQACVTRTKYSSRLTIDTERLFASDPLRPYSALLDSINEIRLPPRNIATMGLHGAIMLTSVIQMTWRNHLVDQPPALLLLLLPTVLGDISFESSSVSRLRLLWGDESWLTLECASDSSFSWLS